MKHKVSKLHVQNIIKKKINIYGDTVTHVRAMKNFVCAMHHVSSTFFYVNDHETNNYQQELSVSKLTYFYCHIF
jgi:hypothetical protein